MSAPIPEDEAARLAALRACQILDTVPEAAFERITSLASQVLDMPITAITFIDRDRQWFKSIVGLEGGEISREISFCAHTISQDDLMVVPDAAADPRFVDNPFVTGELGIRFYAGATLHSPEGHPLGALCVLDRLPRQLEPRQLQILRDLAAMVIDELALRREITGRRQAESALIAQHRVLQDANESIERRVQTRTAELTGVNETLQAEISRRIAADEERARSEQLFRQLFNHASDAAYVHDVDGWILDANEAACANLGYSRAEVLKLNVRDHVSEIPAGGFPFWRELPVGAAVSLECENVRKDGSTFPVEAHVTVMNTVDGRRMLALVRDITERKRTEEVLRLRAREQSVVARLGARALSGSGMEELLHEAVALVGSALGVEQCRVHEHLPAQGIFVVRASLDGAGTELGGVVSGDGVGFSAGYVLHHRQPVIMDLTAETRFEPPAALLAEGFQSALCVPVGGADPGELPFGVLGVASRRAAAFTEDDSFFAQSVANVLAAAITRRRHEDALRAVEARYQRIAANTPGVVYQYVLRADGTLAIPFMSESCLALFGRESHELQADPSLLIDCVHPEDRTGLVDAVHTSKTALIPLHWQGRHLLPSGEVCWMRIDSRPERLPNGDVICDGIIVDITGEKQREHALRQSEERFRLAILHSPLPIMLHADDGEILQVNDAWTHITGYMAEELVSVDNWLTRAYPETNDRGAVQAFLTDLTNHIGAASLPGQCVRCADGSKRIWDFTCANLDRLPDGRWLHITAAVDITERHRGEDALRAARDEAERANRAKSVFLSRMSHELRTPLNAILGFGQLLEMSTLDTQDSLSLNYIIKGGRHLLALIDEVLDLSRAETGDLFLVLGHVSLATLAQECVGLVTRLAQARGITCQVKIPRQASLWVDESRLRQMLLNLLSNAIKYNREGGRVMVSSKKLPSGRLRLSVADTGPGITAEGMARLFTPFERLDQEFGEVEGTGLGLVVSRRIAEAMGGSVGVESAVGQGSTFWIELPPSASQVPARPRLGLPTVTAAPARAIAPRATLLYIEDNVSNLQVVQALLVNSRPHWQFLSARDGPAGLDQARRHLPGLILLDLQLPGMKGDAVLSELRNDPRTRLIPVVLLSADATPHSRERLLASGADEYISKPFKLDNLLELLDRSLLQAATRGQD